MNHQLSIQRLQILVQLLNSGIEPPKVSKLHDVQTIFDFVSSFQNLHRMRNAVLQQVRTIFFDNISNISHRKRNFEQFDLIFQCLQCIILFYFEGICLFSETSLLGQYSILTSRKGLRSKEIILNRRNVYQKYSSVILQEKSPSSKQLSFYWMKSYKEKLHKSQILSRKSEN